MSFSSRVDGKSAPLVSLVLLLGTVGLGTACSGELGGMDTAGGGQGAIAAAGAGGVGVGAAGSTAVAPPVVVPAEPSDWFSAVKNADCSAATTLSRTRIRRLSTPQWANTVQAAFGVAADVSPLPSDAISSNTGFNTDADANKINVQLANAYFDLAQTLAPAAATSALTAHPCLSTTAADPACSSAFIADFGRRLFRRPLAAEETTRYATLLSGEAALDTPDVAVGTVIRAMMMSPNMVYLTELGSSAAGEVGLTQYEQAALISYLIADAPPDAMLAQAADQGLLSAPAERATHASRLLQTPASHAKYADFWEQYVPVGDLRQATGMDPALVTAIGAETQAHFNKIVWEQGGTFANLLTAQSSFGDANLSQIYGTMAPDGSGGNTLPAGERSGFLTQAALLFNPEDASEPHKVIQRGLIVRNRLLCKVPAPPPAALIPNPADLVPLGADATALESYQAFTANNPSCAGCHNGFQPFGLAFEAYDDQGRYRDTYPNGKPIITNGEILDAGDASGTYGTVVEMAALIGNSEIGEYCFSRQYAEYALGRHLNAAVDACTIQALGNTAPDSAISQLAVVLSEVEAGSNRFHTVVQ